MSRVLGDAFSHRVVRKGFSGEVAFEQILKNYLGR